MLHKPDFRNIEQALSATRHEQIEAEYAKTQSYYAPPTSYKAQAMEWIESLERDDNDSIFQGYKYANIVIDEESGKAMEYRELLKHPKHKETWSLAGCKEYRRLFQGFGRKDDGTKQVEGTNTCHWIPKSKVPKNKKVTYARTVVDVRPEKEDPNRVRITAGGNLIQYAGELTTRTADLTVKEN